MNIRKRKRSNRVTVRVSDLAEEKLTEADWDWINEACNEIIEFLESKEASE